MIVSPPNSLGASNVASMVDGKRPGSNFLEVCLRRKAIVVAAMVVCLTAAILYLCLATRIYTSTSRLYVEENGPSIMGQETQSSTERTDAYNFRQCQVIRGEPILRQVIARNPAAVLRMYHAAADPLPELQKNLSVEVGKKDEILTVELSSAFPVEAAQVLNSIVDCYKEFQSKQTRSTATQELEILQAEKTIQDKLLDEQLKEIVAFKQKNGEMFFTNERGMNIMTQNLATISEQLTQAKLRLIQARVQAANQTNQMLGRRMVQEAQQEADGYEREFETEKQKALAINSAEAEYEKMKLEADRTTKLCDVLDQRIKELDVTRNSGSMNIQVLEVAKAEEHPTQPKKAMTLIAAMAAGVVLGGGLAVVTDHLDQRIRVADEAAHLLGLPVLGVIPAFRFRKSGSRSQIGRAVETAPTSAMADAYQAAAVALHVAWPKENVKTLLVTSPNRGDGKSTTCSNLAIAMASAGRRTLLIDADLRRPAQHEIFGVLNAVGVSDVVTRGLAVEKAIQTTGIAGLSLLACGALPPNPAEIVRSQAFTRMVEGLEEQYDLIIIDSPPILAAPDARILGAQADVALLVIRCESSTRHDAEQAAKNLRGVGSNLVGLVFNGVPQRRSNYYYQDDSYGQSRQWTTSSKRIEGEQVVEVEPVAY